MVYIYIGLKIRSLKGKVVYKEDISKILDLIDEAHRMAISQNSFLVKYTSGMKDFVVDKILSKLSLKSNTEENLIQEYESLFEIVVEQNNTEKNLAIA